MLPEGAIIENIGDYELNNTTTEQDITEAFRKTRGDITITASIYYDCDCLSLLEADYPVDADGNATAGYAFWASPGADIGDDGEPVGEFICPKCWDDHGYCLNRFAASTID